MSDLPDPPPTLQCNRRQLPAGTLLHRLHDPRFGGTEFNPGYGSSRFAPLRRSDGSTAATLYAGTSLECAIFEYIFHDIDPEAAFKSVFARDIEPLLYSVVELTASTELVPLFTPDLQAMGLRRSQLIDTPRSAYPETQRWAAAIAEAAPDAGGLVWVSRQYDEEQAVMLIEDRLAADMLDLRSTVRIGADPGSYGVVEQLARRADITIVI